MSVPAGMITPWWRALAGRVLKHPWRSTVITIRSWPKNTPTSPLTSAQPQMSLLDRQQTARSWLLRKGDDCLWAEGVPAANAEALLKWLRAL